MDIRNTRQLKDFSAGRLANAREGQKIILYFSLITIAVSAVATVVSYILSQQIAKTGGLGSMGVRSALTTAQMLLPIVQAVFLMCLELGYLSTMLRIARGQYASPNGMRLGFDRFWVLLRCTLLKGLIFGGVAMASLYVAMMIYMMTPLSNSAVDILMPLVKNAGTSGILLDDATYAQLMDATMPAMGIFWCAVSRPCRAGVLPVPHGGLSHHRPPRHRRAGGSAGQPGDDEGQPLESVPAGSEHVVVLRRHAGVHCGQLRRPAPA